MNDYVLYHNAERRGYWCNEKGTDDFEVMTNARLARRMAGQRIWLIGGKGQPRHYYLCYYFIVDEIVESGQENFRYFLRGTRGKRFTPPILLDGLPWFKEFLHSQQNFRFGLRRVEDKFVQALFELDRERHAPPVGAGFGDVLTNRQVEKAAVKEVASFYKRQGWEVQSVEANKVGFDLLCTKNGEEKHVEVKGVRGSAVAFFVTPGEVERARTDPHFILCVVTEALTEPKMQCFSGNEFLQKFTLTATTYRAEMKD